MKQTKKRCLILKTSVILILSNFLFSSRTQAQPSAFLNVPEIQFFKNKNDIITVKNVKYTEYYKEYDCKWETTHAVVGGIKDTTAQNYINDWLSGMTFFGTCDGDKECFDIASFHYFYKMTYVTYVQNDLFGFFLKTGNCKNDDKPCCENQDWELYDLKQKRFLLEADIFKQDTKSQNTLFSLIANRVEQKHLKLVPDWKAFDRQIGLERKQSGILYLVVYLLEDVVGVNKGLKLEFSAEEILPTLKPEIAKRIFK
ncbi:hypothetical protein [Emticicia sp. SJ17W-69]|uniref:hypothetical protein n=1 Tax=Emticicia sp. SJ17W-69 TaxID=3421657 RepID=UPI003EBAACBD